jgi:hypothetical protein
MSDWLWTKLDTQQQGSCKRVMEVVDEPWEQRVVHLLSSWLSTISGLAHGQNRRTMDDNVSSWIQTCDKI